MDKLLLIDGHNLLFQMFFGMPSRIVNKAGRAIQGTLGFIGALRKIIGMTMPTHLLVMFDGEHENRRTELLADYKANRVDYSEVSEEQNPFSQLNDIYHALDHIGICHAEAAGRFEADDIIASYVHAFDNKMNIVISSHDSDYFQLIGENVTVLRYRGSRSVFCDSKYVCDKYGVPPSRYADFKSLTGDVSDNIKGAKGVGPITAAALIRQFGSLPEVLENADKIERKHIRESVLRSAERLETNYKLIRLDGGAELPFSLSELGYAGKDFVTGEVLRAIGL